MAFPDDEPSEIPDAPFDPIVRQEFEVRNTPLCVLAYCLVSSLGRILQFYEVENRELKTGVVQGGGLVFLRVKEVSEFLGVKLSG